MTQTHRGGGVGGISESYCPKCDVSKAFRTGWAVVKAKARKCPDCDEDASCLECGMCSECCGDDCWGGIL